MQTMRLRGYFAKKDVSLVERNEEDVASFHEKEARRWLEVYDEEEYRGPQDLDFYPGDRVEVVVNVAVRHIANAKGLVGTVEFFDFDDGYEACQCTTTSSPVTVVFDDGD